MRIIGGEAKGRPFAAPKGAALRPTSDRIKEALFAALFSVDGVSLLDLYAGTGSVGMEALSRGASRTVFIEKDARLSRSLKKNLALFGFAGASEILTMEVKKGIRLLADRQERFDIVFADPPYGKGLAGGTLELLCGGEIVAPGGIIILQHAASETIGERGGKFAVNDQKRYGESVLSFLHRTDNEAERGV
jgi:16S rRNA (guanine966-N2)-methyltransferase